eukprot:8681528-Pyramimonas_sp.AAC.1
MCIRDSLGPFFGAFSGREAQIVGSWSPSWALLGTVLGPSWVVWLLLGPSWGPLGPSLGRLGSFSGWFGAIVGASWAGLERRKTEKEIIQKTVKSNIYMKIIDFCFSGSSWETSWGVLEASWAVRKSSWASWSELSAPRGPLGAS